MAIVGFAIAIPTILVVGTRVPTRVLVPVLQYCTTCSRYLGNTRVHSVPVLHIRAAHVLQWPYCNIDIDTVHVACYRRYSVFVWPYYPWIPVFHQ